MIIRNLIGNVEPSTTSDTSVSTFDVIHPGTNNVVHQVQRSVQSDIDLAIRTCQTGLQSWSRRTVSERCTVVSRAATLIDDPTTGWADRLRDANLAETSVPPWWAQEQVHAISPMLLALVEAAPKALAAEVVVDPHATVTVTREPYGVCFAIAAWNAVQFLTSRAIITPLLAGNTVLFKTSEHTPLAQSLWAELLFEAGLPRDCLCVIHVAAEDAASLIPAVISNPIVRHVNFTGSTRVGSILAGLAGRHLKPTLMELGGKAPVLLLPDADIEVAASHILFGSFMNAGQLCMSTERVIVAKSRYQDLVRALQKSWDTVERKGGRALFSSASADHVRSLVADAVDKGASDLLGEQSTEAPAPGVSAAFFSPTIIGPVDGSMRIAREETFGPISVIISIDDNGKPEEQLIDDMVSIANDTDHGLTAAVWNRNLETARSVGSRLDCGAVHINSPANGDLPHVPHGGWKASGWGRFNGAEGLRSFTQTRSVEMGNSSPHPIPLNMFDL